MARLWRLALPDGSGGNDEQGVPNEERLSPIGGSAYQNKA